MPETVKSGEEAGFEIPKPRPRGESPAKGKGNYNNKKGDGKGRGKGKHRDERRDKGAKGGRGRRVPPENVQPGSAPTVVDSHQRDEVTSLDASVVSDAVAGNAEEKVEGPPSPWETPFPDQVVQPSEVATTAADAEMMQGNDGDEALGPQQIVVPERASSYVAGQKRGTEVKMWPPQPTDPTGRSTVVVPARAAAPPPLADHARFYGPQQCGQVTYYHEHKGFGFIQPLQLQGYDQQEAIFVHHSNVLRAGPSMKGLGTLAIGDLVEYEVGPGLDDKRLVQAIQVRRTRPLVGPGMSSEQAEAKLQESLAKPDVSSQELRHARCLKIQALAAECNLTKAFKELEDMSERNEFASEKAIGTLVTACLWARRMPDAAKAFLKMRDLWLVEQHRWEERGLSFYDFNRPYQESFQELRRAVGIPFPDMVNALGSYREMVPCDALPQPPRLPCYKVPCGTLTVMSFNVLADYLSELFSFQFVVVDEHCQGDFLDWRARRAQVIGEVLRWQPQVLCLQELDRKHWSELEAELQHYGGYTNGPWVARKGRNGTEVSDGLCTLWNPQLWRSVAFTTVPLEHREAGKLIVGAISVTTLQMLGPHGNPEPLSLVVANAHVGWERDANWVESLVETVNEAKKEQEKRGITVGVVACGDFNGLFPTELSMLSEAKMHSSYGFSTKAMASGGAIVTCHNDQYHGGRIPHQGDTSHDVQEGCEGGETDHIVFSESTLQPITLLQIPEHERLTAVKPPIGQHPKRSLPCPEYPSDHVSIMVEFQWVE